MIAPFAPSSLRILYPIIGHPPSSEGADHPNSNVVDDPDSLVGNLG